MASETFYLATDLGTSKISTVIARIGNAGDLKIVGLGVVPSQGILQGRVEDFGQAKEALRESLEEARRYLGRHQPTWNYVTISGDHIACLNTEAQIYSSLDDGLVTRRDLDHLIQISYPEVSSGAEVLHVIPIEFEVDGVKGVRNPIGLQAESVRVESHIVLAESPEVQTMISVLKGCGLSVRSLVAQSLAAGEAVLSEDEKEMGVALADIGAGTVDLTIFRSGNPWYSTVIPMGGAHMTQDLSAAIGVPFDHAEELKLGWSHVLGDPTGMEREVMIPGPPGEHSWLSTQKALYMPLRKCLEEIMGKIMLRVSQAGLKRLPSGGLVVTGGCAEIPGFADIVSPIVGAQVRIGSMESIPGLPSALMKPSHAATVGALLWGIKHQGRERPYDVGRRRFWELPSLFRQPKTNGHNGHTTEVAMPLARRR